MTPERIFYKETTIRLTHKLSATVDTKRKKSNIWEKLISIWNFYPQKLSSSIEANIKPFSDKYWKKIIVDLCWKLPKCKFE